MGLFKKILSVSFKEKSVFCFDYIVNTLYSFFGIVLKVSLWKGLYGTGGGAINGIVLNDMIVYSILSSFTQGITNTKEIYRIDSCQFQKNVDMFVEMLHMQAFCHTPVRQLSLGQRMKAEVALALLHDPSILYLDEPTIGFDVLAKQQIRKFIRERNRQSGITTILTSHDMKDLDSVCKRIIILSKGSILFDGAIQRFKQEYTTTSVAEFTYAEKNTDMAAELPHRHLKVIKDKDHPPNGLLSRKSRISRGLST